MDVRAKFGDSRLNSDRNMLILSHDWDFGKKMILVLYSLSVSHYTLLFSDPQNGAQVDIPSSTYVLPKVCWIFSKATEASNSQI